MIGFPHNLKLLFFVRCERANSSPLRVAKFRAYLRSLLTGVIRPTSPIGGSRFLFNRPSGVTTRRPQATIKTKRNSLTPLDSQERPVNT